MRFLIFTIYAPLAAYGETVMGRRRTSWTRPGRAAVLGMIGAALGVEYDDARGHAALASSLGFAVRTDATGTAMMDYHTFSAGQGARAQRSRTRRQELSNDVLTKVTHREYREDSLHTVALWAREVGQWSLDDIAQALRRPRWVLYVGRKSCPLALPANPEVIEAETLQKAFAQRPALPPAIAEHMQITFDVHPRIASDPDAPGVMPTQIEVRRDGYYARRTFRERTEYIMEA